MLNVPEVARFEPTASTVKVLYLGKHHSNERKIRFNLLQRLVVVKKAWNFERRM